MNKNSTLIIASTYNWKENIIESEKRVGGFRKDGEPFTSLDGLTEILSKHFLLKGQQIDIPFIYRENIRVFKHGISQVTVWRKKS
jgi:hypothetical protein